LAGGIVGVVLSLWYRNNEPQKPIEIWDDDSDESLDYLTENDEENENDNPDKLNKYTI